MKANILNSRLDRQWLRETHLKPANLPAGYALPLWRCALLDGNDDCPQAIHLFADENPAFDADPVAILRLQDDGTYKPV